MRPKAVCHCDLIPQIDNKTQIIIAQHIQERSHPFNTARIVNRSLANSKLVADYAEGFERHSNLLDGKTAILYPHKNAVDLESVPLEQLPKKLLLLDGTWDQAKRMYRNWPAAKSLPHFKLNPSQPGDYRIRLEPNDTSLSTLEATVMALQIVEPETSNVGQLLTVFEAMVERQLAHPNAKYGSGVVVKKPTLNIPGQLLTHESKLVIAYGEAEPIRKGSPKNSCRLPVVWVAQRLSNGEKFRCTIRSETPLTSELLNYFALTESDFSEAVTPEKFRDRWCQFIRPDDILVVFNEGTLRLLRATGVSPGRNISVHAINYDPESNGRGLREFLLASQASIAPQVFAGRSGVRLANLDSLVKYLKERLAESIN